MATEWGIAMMAAGSITSLGAGVWAWRKMAPSALRIRRRIGHEQVRIPIGRMSPEQLVGTAITIGVALGLYIITSAWTHKTGLSIAVALGGFMTPGWIREWRESRRLIQLADQLGRVMAMVSTSLRRGTPLEVSIAEAAVSMPAPLGPVLRNLADATVMGVTLSQAIEQIRTLPAVSGSSDFNVFATEMVVCHVRGANVIAAFEALQNVLAARRKYRQQVMEHMGQHLVQSLVIGFIGLGVLFVFSFMSEQGLQPLLESVVGQMILAASLLGNMFLIRLTHLSLLSQIRKV